MHKIETDVLIVGSGLSGLMACLYALRENVDVTIISKSRLGMGTSSYLSYGAFATSGYGMTVEEHIEKTLNVGHYRNDPHLVRVFAEDAPSVIDELRRIGIDFEIGKYNVMAKGKYPAVGKEVVEKILLEITGSPVRRVEYATVTELLEHDGCVVGAAGFLSSGERIVVISKAVILTTGGASALFKFHDNPVTNIGDGYALAARCGVKLKDMDFIQFYPAQIIEEGLPRIICPPVITEFARIINEKGENIIEKYGLSNLRPLAIRARDKLSKAIFTEMREDHNLYIDLRDVREDKLFHAERGILSVLRKKYKADEKPLKITPCAHFTLGGIPINERCETEKKGIFAAGEVACGVHGENRLGGNALSEACVFGKRAGIYAALFSKTRRAAKEDEVRYILPDMAFFGEKRARDVLKELKNIMWEHFALANETDNIIEGKKRIERLIELDIFEKKKQNLGFCFSLKNALNTALTILDHALSRKHSQAL